MRWQWVAKNKLVSFHHSMILTEPAAHDAKTHLSPQRADVWSIPILNANFISAICAYLTPILSGAFSTQNTHRHRRIVDFLLLPGPHHTWPICQVQWSRETQMGVIIIHVYLLERITSNCTVAFHTNLQCIAIFKSSKRKTTIVHVKIASIIFSYWHFKNCISRLKKRKKWYPGKMLYVMTSTLWSMIHHQYHWSHLWNGHQSKLFFVYKCIWSAAIYWRKRYNISSV